MSTGLPGGYLQLKPKLAGETVTYPFDFSSELSVNPPSNSSVETITSTSTTATAFAGVDTNAQTMVGVVATAGSIVNQTIQGGLSGVVYQIQVTANTSAGQTLTKSALLAVM